MERVWKPLNVNGMRLYRVKLNFPNFPECNVCHIVAAKSPDGAARLIEQITKAGDWIEEPIITGHHLNIYQPASWWEEEDHDS